MAARIKTSTNILVSKSINRRPKVWTIDRWLIGTILAHIGLPILFKSCQIVNHLLRSLAFLQFKVFLIHKMCQICCVTASKNMITLIVLLLSHLHNGFPLFQRRACFSVNGQRKNNPKQSNDRHFHTIRRRHNLYTNRHRHNKNQAVAATKQDSNLAITSECNWNHYHLVKS